MNFHSNKDELDTFFSRFPRVLFCVDMRGCQYKLMNVCVCVCVSFLQWWSQLRVANVRIGSRHAKNKRRPAKPCAFPWATRRCRPWHKVRMALDHSAADLLEISQLMVWALLYLHNIQPGPGTSKHLETLEWVTRTLLGSNWCASRNEPDMMTWLHVHTLT